jgi:hypothetical protein
MEAVCGVVFVPVEREVAVRHQFFHVVFHLVPGDYFQQNVMVIAHFLDLDECPQAIVIDRSKFREVYHHMQAVFQCLGNLLHQETATQMAA